MEFPVATAAVEKSFYVDDGLNWCWRSNWPPTWTSEGFSRGGFNLRKWSCSNPTVLDTIPDDLKEKHSVCTLPEDANYTNTLGVEWNTVMDHFRLKISSSNVTNDSWYQMWPRHLMSWGGSLRTQSKWRSCFRICGSWRWTGMMKSKSLCVNLGWDGDQNLVYLVSFGFEAWQQCVGMWHSHV
jgi:hypothetical protein